MDLSKLTNLSIPAHVLETMGRRYFDSWAEHYESVGMDVSHLHWNCLKDHTKATTVECLHDALVASGIEAILASLKDFIDLTEAGKAEPESYDTIVAQEKAAIAYRALKVHLDRMNEQQ